MSVLRRAAIAALAGALLAGCAGSSATRSVPAAATTGAMQPPSGTRSAAAAASAPSGTLYAAEVHVVHAYPLDAGGTTAAVRSITPHPNQDQYISGLAVSADGTLDILETFYAGGVEQATSGYCRVVVESATASGSPPALGTVLCDGPATAATQGIAVNDLGGFDVLYFNPQGRVVLRRFGSDGATVVNSLTANTTPTYLATDRGGHDYLVSYDGTNARIQSYKSTTTDYSHTQWDAIFIGRSLNVIAVSPQADRTVYVSSGGSNDQINVLAPGAGTISATIGPFPNFLITAMAVDSAGSLYVAMYPTTGATSSVIRVYASGTTGKPPPPRIIHPDPPVGQITGLAIAESS